MTPPKRPRLAALVCLLALPLGIGCSGTAPSAEAVGSRPATPSAASPAPPPAPATSTPRPAGPQASPAVPPAPAGPRRAAAIPPRPPGMDASNLFRNGDFESGREPWFDLQEATKPYWHGFELSDRLAVHGKWSALLTLQAPPRPDKVAIHGVVQEVVPPQVRDPATGETIRSFPEVISGYYRVENWSRLLPKQYLQFVVIVWGGDNPAKTPNHQIRYILAGMTVPPFEISNARFAFLGGAEPETGRWVRFERNLREDWEKAWGAVPRDYDKIRLLFEVRYDERMTSEPAELGRVWFDDLYLGPALPPPPETAR